MEKSTIEGRNPVTEALRSGRAIDKIYVKKGDAVANSVEGTINKAGNYPPAIYNNIVKMSSKKLGRER